MENPRQHIEDRAADFLQRRESGTWGQAEQAELIAWLEASTAHRVAFLRTEAAWEEMGRLKAVAAGLPHRKVPTPEELSATHFFADRPSGISPPLSALAEMAGPARAGGLRFLGREIGGRFFLAASVVFATSLALGSYQLWFTGDRYATPVGGIASVPLADGSYITLNTSSRVRVVLRDTERHVELSQGEAFFEVAHDKSRPFVVQAGSKRVIAVGTQFSVRRNADDLQVIVTEGTVRLESADSPLRVSADGSGTGGRSGGGASVGSQSEGLSRAVPATGTSEVLASAGTIARMGKSGISVKQEQPAEAEEILSWRSGYVVFHETPLSEAVAEFNRYNARQIAIEDATVAPMQLTGKFRATNNDAFVNLLERTYPIHAQRTPSEIVLTGAAPP